jgi:hypothetical protein
VQAISALRGAPDRKSTTRSHSAYSSAASPAAGISRGTSAREACTPLPPSHARNAEGARSCYDLPLILSMSCRQLAYYP